MVNEIFWTDTAKLSVKIIFNYYRKNINTLLAEKIKNKIFEKLKILTFHPQIGAKEDLLSDFNN